VKLPLARIADLVSAAGNFPAGAQAAGYSIDSRTIRPGELFFAVRGEHLDGHDFVEAALTAGALAAVVGKEQAARYSPQAPLLLVEDTLAALQALAHAVRRLWGGKLIAITGSAGKTTTKESAAHLLARRYRVLKSEGNLNNHFGLPLQLLRLEPEHQIAVMELAMSHAGEIAALTRIAQPELGVVICVAPVHLGFFKSVAEIARAKFELVENLAPGSTAVLNADDEYVSRFGRDFEGKVVLFGLDHPADVRAETVELRGVAGSGFTLVVRDQRAPATLPLVGRHNIYNALAAVAVALEYGVLLEEAAAALAELKPADKRGEVLELAGATVINDCYNSNPRALDSMVDALAAMGQRNGEPAQRRIVIAGEMLELGTAGDELHRRSGAHMAERHVDFVLGVRGAARYIVEAAREQGVPAEFVETPAEAGEWLAHEVHPGDVVLLKASRGVKLEQALEAWKSSLQAAGKGL
jgi:UDP-N-acetylmuramoyl-tripeptide--D-alanyl-D-alanine ligase